MARSSAPALFVALALVSAGCVHTSPIDDTARQRARAASEASTLCAGLPIAAIEETLADDPAKVVHARAITDFGGRPRRLRVTGVDLVVRAPADVHDGELDRLFACHAARYESGLASEVGRRDPLGVPGVRIRARRAGDHVVLTLRTNDERKGEELARRALSLANPAD